MTVVWEWNAVVMALLGGALIGVATSLLWALQGRVAGISGILGGILESAPNPQWRLNFMVGLSLVGAGFFTLQISPFTSSPTSLPLQAISGLLVGVGTQLGSGCTSGHGICGLSRRSIPALSATLCFMGSGIAAVWVIRSLGGL